MADGGNAAPSFVLHPVVEYVGENRKFVRYIKLIVFTTSSGKFIPKSKNTIEMGRITKTVIYYLLTLSHRMGTL